MFCDVIWAPFNIFPIILWLSVDDNNSYKVSRSSLWWGITWNRQKQSKHFCSNKRKQLSREKKKLKLITYRYVCFLICKDRNYDWYRNKCNQIFPFCDYKIILSSKIATRSLCKWKANNLIKHDMVQRLTQNSLNF